MPENMENLIQKDEVTLKGKPTYFYAEFGDGKMEVRTKIIETYGKYRFTQKVNNIYQIVCTGHGKCTSGFHGEATER